MRSSALRYLLATAATVAVATSALFGCAGDSAPARSTTATSQLAFRGYYEAASATGEIGAISFLADGSYVFRAKSCQTSACLESGTATLDASRETLTLKATRGTTRTFRVDVLETTSAAAAALSTRDFVEGTDASLVEAGAAAVDAGQKLVEAGQQLIGTVKDAKLDGQPVQLIEDASAGDGGAPANGNEEHPAWPGKIAGVGPLSSPIYGNETTTVQPTGNAVTVSDPKDKAFADDAALAAKYDGTANIYNSHGMPGALIGGVPEDETKKLMNDGSKPLIVASCFSGAPMAGGSTIRRMVSTYADNPTSAAAKTYGCSGYASGSAEDGIGCTGSWLNANGQAVPLIERQRLGLHQEGCSVNALDSDGQELVTGCKD